VIDMQKKLLAVDDEPNNLQVLRQILRNDYQMIFAPNGVKAVEAAVKHLPDLILLDIMMPDMNGYEVCKKLKANLSTNAIPVIFVTAMSEVEDEARGFDVGAVDYIQKPVSGPILLRRVETHLSLVRVQELEKSHKQAVFMLGEAGHYNDTDTGDHIWRMAAYARAIASAAGWDDEALEHIELAAPMHDTGKIGTPDFILQAPRKLTAVRARESILIRVWLVCSKRRSRKFYMSRIIGPRMFGMLIKRVEKISFHGHRQLFEKADHFCSGFNVASRPQPPADRLRP
jgi:putative two-component system response regulator